MNYVKNKFVRFLLSFNVLLFTSVFYSGCAEKDRTVVSSNKYELECVLSSTVNTRDLGGYVTRDGKTTKWGRIFRSDIADGSCITQGLKFLRELNELDVKKLENLGPVVVIDLRSYKEYEKVKDPFLKISGVRRLEAPLTFGSEIMGELIKNEITWDEAYINMVSSDFFKQQIRNIFNAIKDASRKLVIIHCTYGKDRTGIVSALILGLCGVKDEDIINNYVVTQQLLKPNVKDFSNVPNVISTNRSIMEKFLEFIRKQGGYEGFLMEQCGIPEETLNKVKSYLLDD